jgi:hypothetical protein
MHALHPELFRTDIASLSANLQAARKDVAALEYQEIQCQQELHNIGDRWPLLAEMLHLPQEK